MRFVTFDFSFVIQAKPNKINDMTRILQSRTCNETSVVGKGDKILLVKEGYLFKTLMIESSGFKYWVREFYGLESAMKDFDKRVETRQHMEEFFSDLCLHQ